MAVEQGAPQGSEFSQQPQADGNDANIFDNHINPDIEISYDPNVNSGEAKIIVDEIEVSDSLDFIEFSRSNSDTEVQIELMDIEDLLDPNAKRAERASIEHMRTLAGIPEVQGFYIREVDGKFSYVYVVEKPLETIEDPNLKLLSPLTSAVFGAHGKMLDGFNSIGVPSMALIYEENPEDFETFVTKAREREKEKIASGENGAQIYSGVKFVE